MRTYLIVVFILICFLLAPACKKEECEEPYDPLYSTSLGIYFLDTTTSKILYLDTLSWEGNDVKIMLNDSIPILLDHYSYNRGHYKISNFLSRSKSYPLPDILNKYYYIFKHESFQNDTLFVEFLYSINTPSIKNCYHNYFQKICIFYKQKKVYEYLYSNDSPYIELKLLKSK